MTAYLGGERFGGMRRREVPGKMQFIAAADTATNGKPARLKLRRLTGSMRTALSSATAFSVS